jgi:hypothetical protein
MMMMLLLLLLLSHPLYLLHPAQGPPKPWD